MKRILIFVVFFLIGLAVALSFTYFPYTKLPIAAPLHITTQFSLAKAPSESLQGKIATMSGAISWLSRVAVHPVQISSPRQVQQGEALYTGKNSDAGIAIQNNAYFYLFSQTQLSLIQLLPVNVVLQQNKGTVMYSGSGKYAISVVSLHLVTIIGKGEMTIAVNNSKNTVTVTVTKGSAQEGYDDLQNISHMVTVDAGQTFSYDDITRTGTVTGKAIFLPSFFAH